MLIEHADALWRAEEENARRQDAKIKTLLSLATGEITIALIGVSTLLAPRRIEDYRAVINATRDPDFWNSLLVIATGVLLLAVTLATWSIARATTSEATTKRQEEELFDEWEHNARPTSAENDLLASRLTASWNLALPQESLAAADALDDASLDVFSHRYEAAVRLLARNQLRKRSIEKTTELVHSAAFLLALAAFIWLIPVALLRLLG